jgi:hypothetical protein
MKLVVATHSFAKHLKMYNWNCADCVLWHPGIKWCTVPRTVQYELTSINSTTRQHIPAHHIMLYSLWLNNELWTTNVCPLTGSEPSSGIWALDSNSFSAVIMTSWPALMVLNKALCGSVKTLVILDCCTCNHYPITNTQLALHILVTNLMFCWPCIIVYQYIETNVVHFLFSLLRIKGLYMFRPLLTHPQEVLHSSTWYNACMLCQLAAPGLKWNWHKHKCNIPSVTFSAPPEDEQVMLETCRGL